MGRRVGGAESAENVSSLTDFPLTPEVIHNTNSECAPGRRSDRATCRPVTRVQIAPRFPLSLDMEPEGSQRQDQGCLGTQFHPL